MKIVDPLIVHLPDTRGVLVSSYGLGNLKIGPQVYTYSRLPGHPDRRALGAGVQGPSGTCPGATRECEEICYARRPVQERGIVYQMWENNSRVPSGVPPIPADCRLLRLHVGGDFDSRWYILNWITRLRERPDVTTWVYTRSWRVPALLPYLERLRSLPNVQMFASMDASTPEDPPEGWRRAWIDGDPRAGEPLLLPAGAALPDKDHNRTTFDCTPSYVCPEETGRKKNCAECGYCFAGNQHDVTFLRH